MFVRSPDGGDDFGYLPKGAAKIISRQAGPIRLRESDLQHIEQRHGDQIRQGGFESVEAFVASVIQKYNKIYQGGSGALTLRVHGMDQNRFAMIRLEPGIPDIENAEDYYAVKTASLCRKEYLQEKKPLLELDGPIQSSFENPFNPGTKVVTSPSENLLQEPGTPYLAPSSSVSRLFEADQHPDREDPFRVRPEADGSSLTIANASVKQQNQNAQRLTTPDRPIQNHHPPPLPGTAMQDNRFIGFERSDGDSVMETYQSRKYQVEDLGDEGLKVRVLMPNVETEQLPTTDIPQGDIAETIRREIAGTNMKDPMHKSAMDKMLSNALEQQEKLNDLAANLKSPVFEPRAPEKAEIAKEMAPQAQNPEVPTPDQEEKASEVRVMKMGPSVVRPSVEQQIESQDMTKEAPGKMNTVERPNYRPFAAHGADKLPEGFSSEVRVAALVVREGARMTPEMPMEGDDFKGWQVNRIFKQDHPSSEFADFPNDSKRIIVESLTFDTQEEAIAAAKKMEKEPAELDRLYDAKFRSPSNTPERKEFLDNLITKNQQEIASRDWAEKSGRTPVEPSTYRPFVAQTPDVLPEGFAAQSWAKAVVVRDGTRILADKPQENDKVVGWAAGRSVYMDTRNNAYPDIKTLPVERFNFDTQEEAVAAAQKMSKEPISLEKLNTIKEVRDRSGGEWRDYRTASDLLDNMIAEKQQEQEQSKTLQAEKTLRPDKALDPEVQEVAAKHSVEKAQEPEKAPQVESAGDIAEDMKKITGSPLQAGSPFPQQEASPSPDARPKFNRKQRPEVLMADQRGKPLIYDHGDKITVTRRAMIGLGSAARERREAVTEKSLLEARARFGEPVRFEGSPAFQMQTIAMAVKHGIALEPATPLGKKLYEKALEVDQSKNRLGPSQQVAQRPRERQKTPSKGMEI